MTASRIVEALDEDEHCGSRLGLRLEPAAIEQFAFEGREEWVRAIYTVTFAQTLSLRLAVLNRARHRIVFEKALHK